VVEVDGLEGMVMVDLWRPPHYAEIGGRAIGLALVSEQQFSREWCVFLWPRDKPRAYAEPLEQCCWTI
jgi:hypothetical protein